MPLPIITKTKPRRTHAQNERREALLGLLVGCLIGGIVALTVYGYVACDANESILRCLAP